MFLCVRIGARLVVMQWLNEYWVQCISYIVHETSLVLCVLVIRSLDQSFDLRLCVLVPLFAKLCINI